MSPLDCAAAELLLAEHVLAGEVEMVGELSRHLIDCPLCMRLARELENPVVADTLGDLADAGGDTAELPVVRTDHYVRGREIGRGGMGRIVRARDRRLGRAVAIKELLDDRMRARFEREARLTARLQHPAIVSVHEAGRWPSGAPFYAMKYVAGRPLDQRIAATPSLAGRLALLPNLITVAEAIAYAHSAGVIHRDLKPQNVIVGEFGETVVIDWGLAKELGESDLPGASAPYRGQAPLTLAGSGTPDYMPPEQARGESVDERADVYALGATLHHLFAGRPASQKPLPARLPAPLRTIVERAMSPDKEARYRTAAELAGELKRFQAGQLVGAHHYTMRELATRFVDRHRVPVVLSASFVFALVFVGVVAVTRIVAEGRRTEAAAAQVTHALAVGYAERGRALAVDHDMLRALPYLHAALANGVDTQEVRFLLGNAFRVLARRGTRFGYPHGEDVASPDGRWVADGESGLRIRWAPGGAIAVTLTSDSVRRVVWRPDSAVLAATVDEPGPGADRGLPARVQLWSAKDWKPLAVIARPGTAAAIAFSPDGRRLAAAFGHKVYVFASGGVELISFDPRTPQGTVTWDPSGTRLLIVGMTATLWDAATGRKLVSLPTTGVVRAAFTADGRHIVVEPWRADASIEIFASQSGEREGGVDKAASLWSGDGQQVALEDDGLVGQPRTDYIQTSGRLAIRRRHDLLPARGLTMYSLSGPTLAPSDDQGRSSILHPSIDVGADQAIFAGADQLLTVGGPRWLAAVWDVRTGARLHSLPRRPDQAGVEVVAIVAAGEKPQAYIHDVDGFDRLWDAESGTLQVVPLPPGPFAGRGSRDGRLVVKEVSPGHIVVFDRARGGLTTERPAPTRETMTPDGRKVLFDGEPSGEGRLRLTVGDDGVARLWGVSTLDLLWQVPAGVIVSPKGGFFWTIALDEHATRAYISGVVYDLSQDKRSVEEIGAAVARDVPYRIVGGRVEPRPR